MDSDIDLLSAYAVRKDARSFAQIVERYAGMVHATAFRCCRNFADAEDVTQECFLELAQQADRLHTSIPAWLHAVATRQAMRRRNRQHTRQLDECIASSLGLVDDTGKHELEDRLEGALECLPDALRQVLLWRYAGGCHQAEIAAKLEISQATVSRRLDEGLRLLRARLGVDEDAVAMGIAALLPTPFALRELVMRRMATAPAPVAGAGRWGATIACVKAACLATVCLLACTASRPGISGLAAAEPGPAPVPVPVPVADPIDAVMAQVLALDIRRESLHGTCLELTLRAGLGHDVRIICPAALASLGPITVHDEGVATGSVIGSLASGFGLSVRKGLGSIALVRRCSDQRLGELSAALSSPDAGVRANAACDLGDLGDERVWNPLLARLADPAPAVRHAALDALRRQLPVLPEHLDRPAVQASITAALATAGRWERLALYELSGACGLPLPEPHDPELLMRWQATARAAEPVGTSHLGDGLKALSAADIAGAIGGGARNEQADNLIDRTHAAGMAIFGESVSWLKQGREAARWLDSAEIPLEDSRAIALGLACRAGATQIFDGLMPLVDHEDPLVQARVALAMGYAHDPRGLAPLGRLADGQRDREVRQLAIWALGELRGVDSVDVLTGCLDNVDDGLSVVSALVRTGSDAGMERLFAHRFPAKTIADLVVFLHETPAWCGQDANLVPAYPNFPKRLTHDLAASPIFPVMMGEDLLRNHGRSKSWLYAVDICLRTSCMETAKRLNMLDDVVRENAAADVAASSELPGRATPVSPPEPGTMTFAWKDGGRTADISISDGIGVIRPTVVTLRNGDGTVIVSYLASAFKDAQGTLHINGRAAILGGPQSADYVPDNFAIQADGQALSADGQGRSVSAGRVERSPRATPPPRKGRDF